MSAVSVDRRAHAIAIQKLQDAINSLMLGDDQAARRLTREALRDMAHEDV